MSSKLPKVGHDCEPDRLCAKDRNCTRCHKRTGQRYIQEIEEENWGFSGLLTDDWKKQQ